MLSIPGNTSDEITSRAPAQPRAVAKGQLGQFHAKVAATPAARKAPASGMHRQKSSGSFVWCEPRRTAAARAIQIVKISQRAAANHFAAKTSVRRCQPWTRASAQRMEMATYSGSG